jgi:capsular polysaccharide export protein
MKQQPRLRRSFLFLQGPHGSFFPKLGHALDQAGHAVKRLNLNGGDFATWPSGDNYRGREKNWPVFLKRYLKRWQISDLILFGDSRPPHIEAIREAKKAGVRIHVFEEGYVRPDWVTLERDGVNGHSTLPKTADWYLGQARGLAAVPTPPAIPSYATARGWAAFFYYAEVVLQHWRFPFHQSHRNRNPVWEGITYLRRFRRRAKDLEQTTRDLARVEGRRYFLFPLQLNSDYQIRIHSRFGNMHAAIQSVLKSFAHNAPADTCLVIKEHPLDAGLCDWRVVVQELADTLNIADRVIFCEQGNLLDLVRGSQGMVTVNSTSGTLSLAAGVPVKVLGDAIYDIDGVTDQAPLDAYWSSPRAPDPVVWDAFYRVLADRCLIHGAFLSNAGIDLLVAVATSRLTAHAMEISPAR